MRSGDFKPTPKKESQRRGVRWNEGDMREEPFMAHCGAEMGIQITLLTLCANLHASMPPTGCTDRFGRDVGGWTGNESAAGEERGGAAMEGGEEITDCSGSGRRIEWNNPGGGVFKEIRSFAGTVLIQQFMLNLSVWNGFS